MRDIGIATQRPPELMRDERGRIHLTLRGTSDARSSVDRDTRLRIQLTADVAAQLWRLLDHSLTVDEKGPDVAGFSRRPRPATRADV